MNGLRNFLTREERLSVNDDIPMGQDPNAQTIPAADDDQAMTGMMNDTVLNNEENDGDDEEVLEDSQLPVFP